MFFFADAVFIFPLILTRAYRDVEILFVNRFVTCIRSSLTVPPRPILSDSFLNPGHLGVILAIKRRFESDQLNPLFLSIRSWTPQVVVSDLAAPTSFFSFSLAVWAARQFFLVRFPVFSVGVEIAQSLVRRKLLLPFVVRPQFCLKRLICPLTFCLWFPIV